MRDNGQKEAMESDDYVIDSSFLRTKNNGLLNNDGTGPNRALTDPRERALAAIALAVHQHARHLTPDQAELAVKWMKKWKLRDALPADINDYQASKAFDEKLNALRNSPEQVRLQSVAARHGTWSRLWGALSAAALAAMIGMGIAGGAGAIAWIIAAVVLVGALIQSERSMVRAFVAAKEQDRKYALESLRAATTVTDLLNAGLCSYIPGAYYEGGDYDEKLAQSLMYLERERLADALYLDREDYLSPYNWRDNGPRV